MILYPSFTECYYDLIDQVHNHFEYECAPRDKKIRELLGAGFAIENPRNRLLYIPEREFSLTYAIAELLWYTLGEDKTEWITNYSAFWKDISDDGKTANSAYGARIFKPHPRIAQGRFTQWDYVKAELTKDPDSRRAVIHIRTPNDSVDAKLDVPCTLSLQFFIREGKLHLMANMRSTDVIFGLSYDVPAFTFFQELLAFELGIPVGHYMHVSNSLHVYEKHFEMCDKILDGLKNIESLPIEMPAFMTSPPLHALNDIQWAARSCESEKAIEGMVKHLNLEELKEEYWCDWAKILISHRARKLKLPELANKIVQSTSFEGYHKFSR